MAERARGAAAGRWLGERTQETTGRYRFDERLPGVTGSDGEIADAVSPGLVQDSAEAHATGTYLVSDPMSRTGVETWTQADMDRYAKPASSAPGGAMFGTRTSQDTSRDRHPLWALPGRGMVAGWTN